MFIVFNLLLAWTGLSLHDYFIVYNDIQCIEIIHSARRNVNPLLEKLLAREINGRNFATSYQESCGDDDACENACSDIFNKRGGRICEDLTVSRAETVFDAYDLLESADKSDFEEINLQDFGLLISIDADSVKDILERYDRANLRNFQEWLCNYFKTRPPTLRGVSEGDHKKILTEEGRVVLKVIQ